jgi:predicted molibdopterin-dependent oxidoreductase YjgC
MTAMSKQEYEAMPVEFKLNGKDVVGYGHETIIQTAQRLGVEIPRLCYKEGMRPDGNCRACMVEIKGERVLAPSCCRKPAPGMEVTSDSARAVASQKMVLELLLSDMPKERHTLNSELDQWAGKLKVGKPRFAPRHQPPPIFRISAWPSTSIRASSARAACAPAAKSRSMTSSVMRFAASTRKSCSISTIRWAIRPASPAANVCRRARPAR